MIYYDFVYYFEEADPFYPFAAILKFNSDKEVEPGEYEYADVTLVSMIYGSVDDLYLYYNDYFANLEKLSLQEATKAGIKAIFSQLK